MADQRQSLGIVKTHSFVFASKQKMRLDSGKEFGPITIAYETYGNLNETKTNAVLICHAFTGNAHVAGYHEGSKGPGWWDELIGPGKGIDTNKYFVICSNVLGSCAGSTGPSSINSETARPFALNFPLISIHDMVRCQHALVTELGIEKLLCVVGGSMGGMQALSWAEQYPNMMEGAVFISTAMKHSPQQIAFNEVGRQAIIADPSQGLAVARMLGHITYMSNISMGEKFGRQKKEELPSFEFSAPQFEVESYLHYNGNSFVQRFDANSYLYLTKAMDHFDAKLTKTDASFLVISFKSDWLYPPEQSKEIVHACKRIGIEASYCEISSNYGHDAFLIETEQESHLIKHFLEKLSQKKGRK